MSDTLAALSGTGRRRKIHDTIIHTKVPSAVKRLVQRAAADRGDDGWTESDVVRDALREWFEKRNYGTASDTI